MAPANPPCCGCWPGWSPWSRGERQCLARLEVVLLDQEPAFDPAATVLDQVFRGGGDRMALLREHEQLASPLAPIPDLRGPARAAGGGAAPMDAWQAWDLERECRHVLDRLGIGGPRRWGRPWASLSGGNRRRVALAAALVAQPDVLLLDEPTNHLDAEGVEWLQSWLDRYPGALVLVTHDRYLLDRVTRRIVAVERGEARHYAGNYAAYLEQRAAGGGGGGGRRRPPIAPPCGGSWPGCGRAPRPAAPSRRPGCSASRPCGRPRRARSRRGWSMAATAQRLGKRVISGGATWRWRCGERTVAGATSATTSAPEDRVGIIGPNGVGKSTPAGGARRAAAPPAAGRLELGATVKLACFDQHSAVLPATAPERKVIDVVKEAASRVEVDGQELSASQLLERFLFPPAQQHQPVAKLSGGERRRLHLCRLLMEAPNVLLLDEPTNDLDVATLAVLEDFLEDFRGCVVVVSHDRWFLDRTVDRLFVIRQGRRCGALRATTAPSWRPERAAPRDQGPRSRPRQPAMPRSLRLPRPGHQGPRAPARRSYKENRELEALERDLPLWESQRRALEERLSLAGCGELRRTRAPQPGPGGVGGPHPLGRRALASPQ